MHDAVECGRTIRVLSVVDAYTRECLALEVDTSFAIRTGDASVGGDHGWSVVQPLADPLRQRAGADQSSFPGLVRSSDSIELLHIQPGKPDTERDGWKAFTRRLREECLTGELVSESV